MVRENSVHDFDLGALFLLGVFGTGHCLGMCGPLVLTLSTSEGAMVRHIIYHFGRVFTYVCMGIILGALGAGLAGAAGEGDLRSLDQMIRIQVACSLFAALFLLGFGLMRVGILPEPSFMSIASPVKFPGFKRILDGAVRDKKWLHTFVFGAMMGFLPCGLSYAAFARALPSGGAFAGGLLVLAFGLGTVPGLLFFGTTAAVFARAHRRLWDLISGAIMIGMAVSLVVNVAL